MNGIFYSYKCTILIINYKIQPIFDNIYIETTHVNLVQYVEKYGS